jgi:benzoate-CoA ligase
LPYGALATEVQRVAGALQAGGVRREERVFLLMHDCIDWPCAFLGAMYAGSVPVAANTLLTADDYAYMLGKSRSQLAVVSQALLPVLLQAMALAPHELRQVVVSRAVQPLPAGCIALEDWLAGQAPATHCAATHPQDPGFWLFSSGSTGRPKATVHSQVNPYWTAKLYGQEVLGLTERDVCFSAAKLFFAYGLGNALSFPLSVGATTVLMAERPTPDAVFQRLQGHVGAVRPTAFFGAPTLFAAMLASPALPAASDTAVRLVSSAGEALPADIGQRFKAHFGVDIIDGIGSTEMLHIYLSNQPGKVRYGTTGWPVPGYDIALRDDAGHPVPDGETGDLFIRGPSAAMLYWGNREKTIETFQGAWTRSGDKYIRNADGSYTYSGRSDDMLKVSGVYVSPFEVESTLIEHPAVLEAAVIGVPDADGLTKTKAYVVCKAGQEVSADELKAFVKDRLAPFKYPRLIEFVSELPKTATGKIQRFKLRALATGQA